MIFAQICVADLIAKPVPTWLKSILNSYIQGIGESFQERTMRLGNMIPQLLRHAFLKHIYLLLFAQGPSTMAKMKICLVTGNQSQNTKNHFTCHVYLFNKNEICVLMQYGYMFRSHLYIGRSFFWLCNSLQHVNVENWPQ